MILVLMALLLPSVAFAQTEAKQISDIVIVGNDHISKDAIMAVIQLKPGQPYSEATVQTAKQSIEKMGYFSSVTAGLENLGAGARVVLNVVENPVVKEISITGNTVIKTDKLRSLMRTSIGSVLNTSTFRQDLLSIENYYSEHGYVATVTEKFRIDEQTGVLSIPVIEVRVESITVTGNKKTKSFVVLREMHTKVGDVFNRDVMLADIRRIYDLDIFDKENAEMFKANLGSTPDQVKIIIPVKEKKTGEVSVGIGYSSEQKLIGQTKISESNFHGLAQKVNVVWEQSLDRGSSAELGWVEPWLDKKHTSLNINLYDKLMWRFNPDLFGGGSGSATDYSERRAGGNATVSRPLSNIERGSLGFRAENVSTEGFTSLVSSKGTVISGTMGYTRTTKDSEIEPFKGTYNYFSTEIGTADSEQETGVFSSSMFEKYTLDSRMYLSNGGARKTLNERRPVLAIRAMASTISGDVPFYEQEFLGGSESLRGYREDRFWGKNKVLVSIEPRIPLAPSLVGVLFVDAGDAWGQPDIFRNPNNPLTVGQHDLQLQNLLNTMPQTNSFKPHIGYGLGIRVLTPLGPLRLDYGFGSEGSRAHFSFGHAF